MGEREGRFDSFFICSYQTRNCQIIPRNEVVIRVEGKPSSLSEIPRGLCWKGSPLSAHLLGMDAYYNT